MCLPTIKFKFPEGSVIIWRLVLLVARLFANTGSEPKLRHLVTLKLEWTRLLKKAPRGVSSAFVSGTSPWESPVEELWKIYQIPASWKKSIKEREKENELICTGSYIPLIWFKVGVSSVMTFNIGFIVCITLLVCTRKSAITSCL